MSRFYVRSWSDLERLRRDSSLSKEFDFVVLYPPDRDQLNDYLDAATTVTGPLDQAFHVTPSLYNELLHVLNRKHNPSYDAWIYRPIGRSGEGGVGSDCSPLVSYEINSLKPRGSAAPSSR